MRIRTGIVVGVLLTLTAGGCGKGPDDEGVASAGSQGATASKTPSASATGEYSQETAVKYGQCMRDNGIKDFPDPEFVEGGGVRITMKDNGISKEKVDAASKACRQYLPNGGEPPKLSAEDMENARKFSQCMRENGVPKFPDPLEGGGIQLNLNELGMSGPDDPKLRAAEQVCAKFQPRERKPDGASSGVSGSQG